MTRISSVTLHQVTRKSEGNKDIAQFSREPSGLASTISLCDHMGAVSTHHIWGVARNFRFHLSFPNYPFLKYCSVLPLRGRMSFSEINGVLWVFDKPFLEFPRSNSNLFFELSNCRSDIPQGSAVQRSAPTCCLTSYLPFHVHPPWKISRKKGRGQSNSTVGKLKYLDKIKSKRSG